MDAQAKEIKNKVMCEINSIVIVYFFFDDRVCFFSKTNILIPNVAEKNILILVEKKK
jgi:hypothetical protein